jgi:ABC-type dipeptide/oligopeptide/nickel transport system permease component
MKMTKYVIKRLVLMVCVLFIITTICFMLIRMLPRELPTDKTQAAAIASRWEALAKVLPYCDEAEFYDNDNGFIKVAEYRNGELRTVGDRTPNWIIELQNHLKA